jgi:hypothetical protein
MDSRPSIVSVIAEFRERNAGPAAFDAFAEDCALLARLDPLNAGFYVMLGLFARNFTDRCAGEPLTSSAALAAKADLIAQAERVAPALALGPEARLALLNDLAHALASGR